MKIYVKGCRFFDFFKELDRDVTIEEVAPILTEKLSKYLKVPVSDVNFIH